MADFFAKDTADGLADGSNWANCFGPAELDAWATAAALAADRCFCLSGTYVMPDVASARSGSQALPIRMIGVRSASPVITYADWASGMDRPLFQFGGIFAWSVATYWNMHNFRYVGTGANLYLCQAGTGSLFDNCKVEAAGANPNQRAIRITGNRGRVINCELTNPLGRAVMGLSYLTVVGCLLRDSRVGIVADGDGLHIAANLIRDCTIGVELGARAGVSVVGNTFYAGTTGIAATTAGSGLFVNNIISGFTTPAEWTTEQLSNWFDWNIWHNNATPVNVTKGPHAIDEDPDFVDAPGGDFRMVVPKYGLVAPGSLGAVQVGSQQTSPPGAPPAAPSYSGDQFVLDGLETVYLDDIEIQNAYRLQEEVEEQDESQGVYQARNVEWHLPCGPGIYLPGKHPRLGGIVRDVLNVEYQILAVRQPYLEDYWGLITRSLAISGEYNLDNTVTLWRYVDSTTSFGGKGTTFPIADSSFTDVPCKIQEQPEQLKTHIGIRGFARRFDIFLELDIDVRYGDRVVDEEGTIYSIMASRTRDSISRYSVIEGVIAPS